MTGSAGRSDRGVGEAAARAVLLATKLNVPASGAQLVHRAALLDTLSAGRCCKLTLLSAPAGWGKTILLAQWALGADEDQRFGWLSLDPSDNDPVWFWMYVVAALQKISPGVGIRAVELLAMGADPVQVVLPTLLNDLDTIASPMVLILDDYSLVVNRAVHEQLAFFIGRLPASLHLVLATRSDPVLPLARLRASGDLTARKLIPALYHLCKENLLPPAFRIVGTVRDQGLDRCAARSGFRRRRSQTTRCPEPRRSHDTVAGCATPRAGRSARRAVESAHLRVFGRRVEPRQDRSSPGRAMADRESHCGGAEQRGADATAIAAAGAYTPMTRGQRRTTRLGKRFRSGNGDVTAPPDN